jgi:hypothetical protein
MGGGPRFCVHTTMVGPGTPGCLQASAVLCAAF